MVISFALMNIIPTTFKVAKIRAAFDRRSVYKPLNTRFQIKGANIIIYLDSACSDESRVPSLGNMPPTVLGNANC